MVATTLTDSPSRKLARDEAPDRLAAILKMFKTGLGSVQSITVPRKPFVRADNNSRAYGGGHGCEHLKKDSSEHHFNATKMDSHSKIAQNFLRSLWKNHDKASFMRSMAENSEGRNRI